MTSNKEQESPHGGGWRWTDGSNSNRTFTWETAVHVCVKHVKLTLTQRVKINKLQPAAQEEVSPHYNPPPRLRSHNL